MSPPRFRVSVLPWQGREVGAWGGLALNPLFSFFRPCFWEVCCLNPPLQGAGRGRPVGIAAASPGTQNRLRKHLSLGFILFICVVSSLPPPSI